VQSVDGLFRHIVRCRSVGVSNFGVQHLEGLREAGRPAPSVNQIELHAVKRQQHIVDYCHKHDIAVMGYSPMAKGHKMTDDTLAAVASRYRHSHITNTNKNLYSAKFVDKTRHWSC